MLGANQAVMIGLQQVSDAGGGIAMVSAGYLFTVILTNDGDVYAWGTNSDRQVDPTAVVNDNVAVVTYVRGGVKYIETGYSHTMAVLDNGDLVGWGKNHLYQCQPALTTADQTSTTAVVRSGVEKVFCGQYNTMALLLNGDIVGWGNNDYGQVGIGEATPNTDTSTVLRSGVVQCAMGTQHTTVLLTNGDVVGWGRNNLYQADPNAADTSTITNYTTVVRGGISQIVGKAGYVLCICDGTGVEDEGDVVGWGSNSYREAYPASATNPWRDETAVIVSGATQLSSGQTYNISCLLSSGSVVGWGRNIANGIHPIDAISPYIDTTTAIKTGVAFVGQGGLHTICILDNDDVIGWGYNASRNTYPTSATSPWTDTTAVITSV